MSKSFILPLQRLAHALLLLSLVSLVCIRKIHQHLVLCWLYTVIPGNPCKVYFIVKRLNPQGQLKGNSEVSSCWNALTMVHWLPSRWSSSPYFGLIWSLLCVFQILSQRGSRVSCLVDTIFHEFWAILGWRSANPPARSTCGCCSHLIRGQRRIPLPSLCFYTMFKLIHVHRRLQAFASMTLSRYEQTMAQAPVWLSSGPHSSLSKSITVIHSCNQYLTAPPDKVC